MEKLNVANKNLNDENEKHFARLDVEFELNLFVNYDLNENEFSNLTFDTITLNFTSINQIHKNAFGKTAKTLQILYCSSCAIQNSQPNYDPWAAIGQLSKLKELYLGTNVSEIPEIKPLNGSELKKIQLYNLGQKMTVKSGAFQNLNNLQE